MNRIRTKFDSLTHPALITFITAGDPVSDRSVSILQSLPQVGADLIELGMPFTDPVADGSVIQSANSRALKHGATMGQTLQMVRDFRTQNNDTPILLMGYINPIFQYGYEKFTSDAATAGVDGLIIVDLPPEESEEFAELCKIAELDFIRLITPTTDEKRLKTILDGASGFLYYVSVTGVTGAAKPDPDKIKTHIQKIRTQTNLPIAVGFGIKTSEDATTMREIADGIVVGSAIVQTIADHADSPDLTQKISTQVSALSNALKT